MLINYSYLYLLSPLHTGGTTQEGNLVGIARESHTNFPYIPSSSIRGRLRANVEDQQQKYKLFGTELENTSQLEQGNIWIGDGALLWLPVPSLSHGVVWVSCPMLLRRWGRYTGKLAQIPVEYSCNCLNGNSGVYLKDAILKKEELKQWHNWQEFIPQTPQTQTIERAIVLPDKHCATLIQMSLWRQVKIKLDEKKSVDGGLRYEEAIPPDTLMYFTWGITSAANARASEMDQEFTELLNKQKILQIGGQESLGRGFVQQWV
ncbi:Cmr4 family CRISPR-associated RAMP protein [Chondrocystis sp. NIES-4102]|nr:Cmr4 family CRISPR-associated RAMP protein [Chondrocystis sp. NIES-4102]